VRFVGTAENRIREDYLRILRFFRFTAWYGDPAEGVDAEGLAACAALAGGMSRLSVERVWAELRKTLGAPDPGLVVGSMAQAGILAQCLPGTQVDALPQLLHAEAEMGLAADPLRRLVALGGDAPEAKLRLSRAETREVQTLRAHVGSADPPLALGFKLGVSAAHDVVALRFALLQSPFSEQMLRDLRRGADAIFPVQAVDLPDTLTGPQIGQALTRLKSEWLAADCRPTKAELLGRL
ncbi:MAG: CCA tRNA nucleotidyltransferase, partial [Pseudomonadota bacterium]